LSKKYSVMKSLLNIILIAAAVGFSSCEKTVYFDVATQENRLVVNAEIQAYSDGAAQVTLSADPLAIGLEGLFTVVSDATISISKNDVMLGTYTHEIEGEYSIDGSILNAVPGDVFEITVSAPDRTTVTATTSIPSAIPIYDVTILDTVLVPYSYSIIDEFGNVTYIDTIIPYLTLAFSFDDPDGEDFYSLAINYEDLYSESFTCFTTADPTFTVNDNYDFGNENNDGQVTLCDKVTFTDVTFEGTSKTMNVNLLAINTTYLDDPKFVIELQHLSREAYLYETSARLQNGNGDNPFGEPVTVFSNIENGFGIFSGKVTTIAILEL
jgi:hypothetical protein